MTIKDLYIRNDIGVLFLQKKLDKRVEMCGRSDKSRFIRTALVISKKN